MGPNAFVDVAIGLVLMYLGLSVFCTVINELLATVLRLRATSLATGIAQLLDDPTIRADFYSHGLINCAKEVSASGSTSGQDHPSYISGNVFAMALLGSLDPTKPVPVFADIESAIKHFPDSNIRDVLLAHVVTAGQDLTKLRDGVATWYDHSMDRVSGVYKRKLKVISCIVGLLLATAVNADTITVATALWHDNVLREQIVKIADHTVTSGLPVVGRSAESSAVATSPKDVTAAAEALRPFPLGWDFNKTYWDMLRWNGVLKLAGLLLTTVALTLGAPFWFDLLSKFMRLRGTGDKPARTGAS
jgi:hypothetical protein